MSCAHPSGPRSASLAPLKISGLTSGAAPMAPSAAPRAALSTSPSPGRSRRRHGLVVQVTRGRPGVTDLHQRHTGGVERSEGVLVGPAGLALPVPHVQEDAHVVRAGIVDQFGAARDGRDSGPRQELDGDRDTDIGGQGGCQPEVLHGPVAIVQLGFETDRDRVRRPHRRRHAECERGIGTDCGLVACVGPTGERLDDGDGEPELARERGEIDAAIGRDELVQGPHRHPVEAGRRRGPDTVGDLVGRRRHRVTQNGGHTEVQLGTVDALHGAARLPSGRGGRLRNGAGQEVVGLQSPPERVQHSPTATRPTTGWTGAHQLSAPEVPTSATTAWLQTGQPTAKKDTKPPQTVVRSCDSVSSVSIGARMPRISPMSAAVTARIT